MEIMEKEVIEGIGLNTIRTDLAIGNLSLEYNEGLNIEIESRISIEDEEAEKALENIGLIIDKSENILEIYFEMKDGDQGKLSSIADKVRNKLDLEIILRVPKQIKNFDINLDLGDIVVKDLSGLFDIDANVANIKMENVVLTDYTKIKTKVGDVDLEIDRLVGIKTIDVSSNVGDIRVKSNHENMSNIYRINLRVNVGSVRFYTKAREDYKIILKEGMRTRVVEKGKYQATEIVLKTSVGSAIYKNI